MYIEPLKIVITFYIRGEGGEQGQGNFPVHGSVVWKGKVHQRWIQIPTPGAAAVQPRVIKPLESRSLACQMGITKPITQKVYRLAYAQSCWDSVTPKINQRCHYGD